MTSFSPKIEIIGHFDKLINKVDIDIDESIEKYNDKQVLGEMLRSFTFLDVMHFWNKSNSNIFKLIFHDTEYSTVNLWSVSTKVIDYLNEVRKRTRREFAEL